jgi:tetratricopeptide (TPR) repeat protein
MIRTLTGALLLTAVVAGLLIAGIAVARDRQYQELVARGNRALATDQTFAAIEAFSGAIALKSDSMVAYLRRGEAYRKRDELDAALRDLRTATRLDRSAVRPAELLGDVNYDMGRYGKAADAYQACAAIYGGKALVQYKLGLALYRSGDASAAIAPLREAVALDQRLAEAHYVLGLCLKQQNAPAEAARAFEQALGVSPALFAAREELAGLYADAGRMPEAIEQLEAIAALEPDRPERQAAIGLAQARAGHPDLAVGVLGRAADRYPDNAVIYVALGRVWFEAAERGRDRVGLRKALEALEPVTRGPAVSSDALALYGRTLAVSGDLVRGEAALRRAADILPVAPDTLIWLADAAERLGHYPVVRLALERWAALAPETSTNLPAVYERIGDLSMRMGEARAAVRAWRLAAGPSPSPGFLARLADAELTIGDMAEARRTVARGLDRDPRNPTLLALQRRLQ